MKPKPTSLIMSAIVSIIFIFSLAIPAQSQVKTDFNTNMSWANVNQDFHISFSADSLTLVENKQVIYKGKYEFDRKTLKFADREYEVRKALEENTFYLFSDSEIKVLHKVPCPGQTDLN